MKGVCAPGHAARTWKPEEAAAMRPPLFMVICLHPLIKNAENAILFSLAAIIKIVHSSLKSNEYACKTLENG